MLELQAQLVFGESYRERYAFLWSCIHAAQELVKTLTHVSTNTTDSYVKQLCSDNIRQQKMYIKKMYDELKLLLRWVKQVGLKDYQPYYPKSYWDRLASMSDSELDWRMVSIEQIRDWYIRNPN